MKIPVLMAFATERRVGRSSLLFTTCKTIALLILPYTKTWMQIHICHIFGFTKCLPSCQPQAIWASCSPPLTLFFCLSLPPNIPFSSSFLHFSWTWTIFLSPLLILPPSFSSLLHHIVSHPFFPLVHLLLSIAPPPPSQVYLLPSLHPPTFSCFAKVAASHRRT